VLTVRRAKLYYTVPGIMIIIIIIIIIKIIIFIYCNWVVTRWQYHHTETSEWSKIIKIIKIILPCAHTYRIVF